MREYCVAGHAAGGGSPCRDTAPTGLVYTRTTTIMDLTSDTGCPAMPVSCKQIEVRVSYRPVTSTGTLDQSRAVDVVTVLGPRV